MHLESVFESVDSVFYNGMMTADAALSQRSSSSHWSPVAGPIISARVSEAPPDNEIDRTNQFDPMWKLRNDSYDTLADMAGPPSDFSPLLLPLGEPSDYYHSRLTNVYPDSQDRHSSSQPPKPFTVCSLSNVAQRKQSSGTFLESPAVSEASEQLPWMQGEDLSIELPSIFSEPEEVSDSFNLSSFQPLWS